MQGQRIVQASSDSAIQEMRLNCRSLRHSHDKEVIHWRYVIRPLQHADVGNRAEPLAVTSRGLTSPLVARVEVPEFDPEPRGLQGIHPPVVTFTLVMVLLGLAMVTKSSGEIERRDVVRRERTGLPARTQVLPGIEGEGRRRPHGSAAPTAILRAVGLRRILHDPEVVL